MFITCCCSAVHPKGVCFALGTSLAYKGICLILLLDWKLTQGCCFAYDPPQQRLNKKKGCPFGLFQSTPQHPKGALGFVVLTHTVAYKGVRLSAVTATQRVRLDRLITAQTGTFACCYAAPAMVCLFAETQPN